MKVREFHALSFNREDPNLIKAGLRNMGLLGYLNTTQVPGTRALNHYYIKFPSGPDYFYTTDPSKERLQKREPVDHGPLGYVALKNTTGFIPLHRYFHPKHQAHLYVTNPNQEMLKKGGFTDESENNPLFIQQADSDDAAPLYLYSNSDATYFSQLSTSSPARSRFPAELVTELTTILETQSVPASKFDVSYEGTTSVTISLMDSWLNFYVNSQVNGVYYTVRRNPIPNDEHFIVHDVDNWSGVIVRFNKWLKDVNDFFEGSNMSTTTTITTSSEIIPESVQAALARRVYGHTDISIQEGTNIEPAFGVIGLATQIVGIIKNLKAEPGNMVGIFGPWGRGKTFMMNEIWEQLSSDKQTEYIQVNYQAWRYQHTPANWAYLFEQFSEKFLGNQRRSIPSFFKYHKNLFRLSREREGVYPFLLATLISIPIFISSLFIFDYKGFFSYLFGFLGIPLAATVLVLLVEQLKLDHFTKAFNLIRKYHTKVSFKESLGVQAEIQKELKHLINVFTKSSKKEKQKQIVLFVDDLDRCNEDKIIEIIDSFRIILDDEELKNKLLVVTAVDERILNLAVQAKYKQLTGLDDLSREYIDKLFIFSIKLNNLTTENAQEFFEKFTKNEIHIDTDEDKNVIDQEPAKGNKVQNEATNQSTTDSRTESKPSLKQTIDVVRKLTREEKDIFIKKLYLLNNPTPRKIRIIYYRYLFIKNTLIPFDGNNLENSYWLQPPRHEAFVELLFYFSQRPTADLEKIYAGETKGESEELQLAVVNKITVKRNEY